MFCTYITNGRAFLLEKIKKFFAEIYVPLDYIIICCYDFFDKFIFLPTKFNPQTVYIMEERI